MDKKITDLTNPAPAPGQPRPRQLGALTSVRFLAALHVALYHMVHPVFRWAPLTEFLAAGYTGVNFFFLLSGYILTYSHAKEKPSAEFRKRFYFARFARIYPAYLVVLLVIAYLGRGLFSNSHHVLAFVMDLFVVQTWSTRAVLFFNVPAWTVSTEAFFYLVFPFVVARLQPKRASTAVWRVGLFWALAMLMPMIALIVFPVGSRAEPPNLFSFWVQRFPLFALPEFLAGISLGWIFLRFRPSARAAVAMLWLGGAGLLAALCCSSHIPAMLLHNGVLIPFYALILLGLSEETVFSKVLSFAPFLLLGEASYSFYLIHFAFNDWSRVMFHWDGVSGAAYKLAVTVPVSIGMYLLLERPSRKLLLQWWNKHHPRGTADAMVGVR